MMYAALILAAMWALFWHWMASGAPRSRPTLPDDMPQRHQYQVTASDGPTVTLL